VSDSLSPALIERLGRLDSCAVSNAIETFDVRLRNEGFTDGRVRCLFDDLPTIVGHAVTARIRSSAPPPVGHTYADRTDWWNYVLTIPAPRVVVVQDVDDRPGLGASVGGVHASILRALDCVAYLTNGAARDLPEVRASGLQVFAGGTTPSHAFMHIVDFGGTVEIAGLRVSPGDALLGDRHGVVSIPKERASDIPAVVASMRARERRVIEHCRSDGFAVNQLRAIVEGLD
jgi:4-hydroxy-4-methyl-2-oxoglutarate aldolase